MFFFRKVKVFENFKMKINLKVETYQIRQYF